MAKVTDVTALVHAVKRWEECRDGTNARRDAYNDMVVAIGAFVAKYVPLWAWARYARHVAAERRDREATDRAMFNAQAKAFNARAQASGSGMRVSLIPLDTDLDAAGALLRDVANQDGRGGSP